MENLQQDRLHEIFERIIGPTVQFHGIYCDCERCREQQKKEKAANSLGVGKR